MQKLIHHGKHETDAYNVFTSGRGSGAMRFSRPLFGVSRGCPFWGQFKPLVYEWL